MAKYPIDLGQYSSFSCSVGPKPVFERNSDKPSTDRVTGEPIYVVQLVAFGVNETGAEVLRVKFPGTPHPGLKAGALVKVSGLMVSEWDMPTENKHGLSFRADKVEPVSAAPAAKAGAA